MRRRMGVLLAALAVCAPGCRSTENVNPYPSDPLLVSKKPVQAKATSSFPAHVSYSEPTAPSIPQQALAMRTEAP